MHDVTCAAAKLQRRIIGTLSTCPSWTSLISPRLGEVEPITRVSPVQRELMPVTHRALTAMDGSDARASAFIHYFRVLKGLTLTGPLLLLRMGLEIDLKPPKY